MAWASLTEQNVLDALSKPEVDAYRKWAVVDGTDPLAGLMLGAENTVRGYIGGRYALGASGVPETLLATAVDIAVWRLAKRVPAITGGEKRESAYQDALKLLKDIMDGKPFGIEAPATEDSEESSAAAAFEEAVADAKPYDRASTNGMW